MRLTILLSCLLATPAAAQLSGSYTVDPAGSGARNFTTLNAISHTLAKQGINGPVTVKIADGVYDQTFVIAPIPGASAQQRVTFCAQNRHQARLAAPSGLGTQAAVRIPDFGSSTPVEWVVFKGLHFARTGTHATSIYGIHALGNSRQILVEDCLFEDAILDAKGARRWEISHSEWRRGQSVRRPFDTIRFTDCEAIELHHCQINTHTAGVTLISQRGAIEKNRIWNNIFYGQGSSNGRAMLDLAEAHSTIVEHNTFAPQGPQYGAVCLRIGGEFARPIELRHNIFDNPWTGAKSLVEIGNPSPYFVQSSRNLYHAPNGAPLFHTLRTQSSGGSVLAKDLATLQAATGLETGSIEVDPKLSQRSKLPFDLRPKADSPAIAHARSSGAFVTDDLDGKPRFADATLGAYEGAPPVSFQSFGSGCAGSGGHLPKIGSTGQHAYGAKDFRITLSKALGSFGLQAILALGHSKTSWGSVPLPLALGGGCQLLVSPTLLLPAGISGGTGPGLGTASFNLLLPLDPRLKGLAYHFQWAVPDPQAKGIGLAFSDAGTLKF